MTSELFDKAIKDESLRQAYLDTLCTNLPPYVTSLIYDPEFYHVSSVLDYYLDHGITTKDDFDQDKLKFEGSNFMCVTPPKLLGTGEAGPVYVTGSAFIAYQLEELFFNVLFDHEFLHRQDFYGGLVSGVPIPITQDNVSLFQEETIIGLLELRGYSNQYAQFKEKRINHQIHAADCCVSIHATLFGLANIKPLNDLEKRVLDQRIKFMIVS